MKARAIFSLFLFAASFNAAAITQFKPAVLNAALLFEHDPTTGNVKHSLQWIRDLNGKLRAMTDVSYDSKGCFTHINMVDKANVRVSFNAAAITQFKPAVLNAALLFEHDPTTGNVKHS
ncbi:YnfC family lipoprotein, partial [Kluyvera sichuanensis]